MVFDWGGYWGASEVWGGGVWLLRGDGGWKT